jgi:hypothetical protein
MAASNRASVGESAGLGTSWLAWRSTTLLGSNGSLVIVENDANLCAVGEHARGAAQGADVVACLTVGTGIGMGILIGGSLFRDAHGAAGEIADLPYGRVPAGVVGRRGCRSVSIDLKLRAINYEI